MGLGLVECTSLGVVGVGAMGGALVRRIVASEKMALDKVFVSDKRQKYVVDLAHELGIKTLDVQDLARSVETIVIAVKPQDMEQVFQELSPNLTPNQLVISLAAGISLARIANWTHQAQPIVRVMPNTPCLVGQGAVVCSPNRHVNSRQLRLAEALFELTGKVWVLPEEQMDAVTGVSGSGPAYVYLFLEALIEGGVAAGLGYTVAKELALQTVLGATRLAMETGQHPAILRNMVTSPAGTTVAALRELEAGKLRSVVIEAVLAASAGAKALGEREPEGGRH